MLFMLRVTYDLCYKHTFGRLVDLERPSLDRWPNNRSDQNIRWLKALFFISLRIRVSAYRSIRIPELEDHTLRYDTYIQIEWY